MPKGSNAELRDVARGCALLSDRTRLGILSLLANGPKNVTALCNAMGLRAPTASYHLSLLRMGRLVKDVRQGKCVVYATDKANMKALASAFGKLTKRDAWQRT